MADNKSSTNKVASTATNIATQTGADTIKDVASHGIEHALKSVTETAPEVLETLDKKTVVSNAVKAFGKHALEHANFNTVKSAGAGVVTDMVTDYAMDKILPKAEEDGSYWTDVKNELRETGKAISSGAASGAVTGAIAGVGVASGPGAVAGAASGAAAGGGAHLAFGILKDSYKIIKTAKDDVAGENNLIRLRNKLAKQESDPKIQEARSARFAKQNITPDTPVQTEQVAQTKSKLKNITADTMGSLTNVNISGSKEERDDNKLICGILGNRQFQTNFARRVAEIKIKRALRGLDKQDRFHILDKLEELQERRPQLFALLKLKGNTTNQITEYCYDKIVKHIG